MLVTFLSNLMFFVTTIYNPCFLTPKALCQCNHKAPYLRVYKPHFFDKNLHSKIGVRLFTELKDQDPPRKSRYHIDD
jgi:hypothetical protein